jgi:ABC-2 type transport system permease protein
MGRHLGNIFHLGVKELRSLWYDKILLLLVVWTFSGGIYTAATATSQELHNAPIAIADEDRSQLSQRIVGTFYGPYFKTPESIGLAQIDPGLDAGRYTFVLDIPPHFERDVLAGRRPALQINIDATQMSQAFVGAGYIQAMVGGEIGEYVRKTREEPPAPVTLALHTRFNPNLDTTWFGSVMEIINNITMLSIILTGAALIREREHGTIEHLLVMPLGPAEIMLGKIWSMGLVVLVAATLSLTLMVQGVLQVPIAGSLTLFLVGAALHLFSTTAMGILIGTVARSMPQLGLLIILVLLPLELLSGGITPRESMPAMIRTVMQAAPTTHFVSFAQAILYRGAGLAVVWPQFLALAALGMLFFAVALYRFRRTMSFG